MQILGDPGLGCAQIILHNYKTNENLDMHLEGATGQTAHLVCKLHASVGASRISSHMGGSDDEIWNVTVALHVSYQRVKEAESFKRSRECL